VDGGACFDDFFFAGSAPTDSLFTFVFTATVFIILHQYSFSIPELLPIQFNNIASVLHKLTAVIYGVRW
jgi:hypothetical protein